MRSEASCLCSATEGPATSLSAPTASQVEGELGAPRGSLLRRDTPSPSAFQRFRTTSLSREYTEQGIPEHEVRCCHLQLQPTCKPGNAKDLHFSLLFVIIYLSYHTAWLASLLTAAGHA